jgi:hypothetical protein
MVLLSGRSDLLERHVFQDGFLDFSEQRKAAVSINPEKSGRGLPQSKT